MNALKLIVLQTDGLIEKLLKGVERVFTRANFERLDSRLGATGLLMAPVTATLFILAGVIGAIKSDSFIVFMASIVATVAFFIVHWCGRTLSANCDLAIANSSARISGYGLFRSVALVGIVGLIGLVIYGIYMSIKFSEVSPLYVPLSYAAAIWFIVWFLLNPTLLSIKSDSSASPGDDALSLTIFGMLSSLRLHRVIFGGGLALGNLAIVYSIFKIMRGGLEAIMYSGVSGFIGVITVFAAAIAPLALYLSYVMYYLIIDLMRAVLRIGKTTEETMP